jgi:hypothetical protein
VRVVGSQLAVTFDRLQLTAIDAMHPTTGHRMLSTGNRIHLRNLRIKAAVAARHL